MTGPLIVAQGKRQTTPLLPKVRLEAHSPVHSLVLGAASGKSCDRNALDQVHMQSERALTAGCTLLYQEAPA